MSAIDISRNQSESEGIRLEQKRVVKSGWVTIFPHNEEPGCKDENGMLVLYPSSFHAFLNLANDIEDHIEQFKKGEREWNDIDFCDELDVRYAEMLHDGTIQVYDDLSKDSAPAYVQYPDAWGDIYPITGYLNSYRCIECKREWVSKSAYCPDVKCPCGNQVSCAPYHSHYTNTTRIYSERTA